MRMAVPCEPSNPDVGMPAPDIDARTFRTNDSAWCHPIRTGSTGPGRRRVRDVVLGVGLMQRKIVLAVMLVAFISPAPHAYGVASAQPGCTFTLGFKALRDLIPGIVGNCLENERFNVANGNAEQRTMGGLLVWRKADNWTAFTDGSSTWINGPYGLVSRQNSGPLFPWEAGAGSTGEAPARLPAQSSRLAPDYYLPEPWELPTGLVNRPVPNERRSRPGVETHLKQYFRNAAQTGLVVGASVCDSVDRAQIAYRETIADFRGLGYGFQPFQAGDEATGGYRNDGRTESVALFFRVGAIYGRVIWIESPGTISQYEAGRQVGMIAAPMLRKMQQHPDGY